jgi:lipopolysaccharide/colanic/teichoic acid biosynthesis glycosyltransferase
MSPEGISNFHGIEGFPAEPMILYTSVKRTLDVAISLALLVLLSPLLVITAAAIRIDSRGPILFTQERMGTRRLRQDGSTYWRLRIFRLYKFRSMTVDADSAVHELHIAAMAGQDNDANAQGVTSIKLRRDPRITRVGRYLRVTSIDELPQLINVLRGEMSLVGPRPVPLYEFARYRPEHLRRFTVLPGISGLWQVRGRCDLSFWEMVSCDLEYAEKPTFWGDLRIMLRTLPAVVSGRGAG